MTQVNETQVEGRNAVEEGLANAERIDLGGCPTCGLLMEPYPRTLICPGCGREGYPVKVQVETPWMSEGRDADVAGLEEELESAASQLAQLQRERDRLREALMPFALAAEEKVRRPINHPLLPDWIWEQVRTALSPPTEQGR